MSSGTWSKTQLLQEPHISQPTCSLARSPDRGQGGEAGESQHAEATAHRGRSAGTPAGPAVVLLAHGHATEGRRRSQTIRSTAAPQRTPHTL